MSVHMKIFITKGEGSEFRITDTLTTDQDDIFYGHIIDMSTYSEELPRIPSYPTLETKGFEAHDFWGHDYLKSLSKDRITYNPENFYLCKIAEFKKIKVEEWMEMKNKAILHLLHSADPESSVLIEMNWM